MILSCLTTRCGQVFSSLSSSCTFPIKFTNCHCVFKFSSCHYVYYLWYVFNFTGLHYVFKFTSCHYVFRFTTYHTYSRLQLIIRIQVYYLLYVFKFTSSHNVFKFTSCHTFSSWPVVIRFQVCYLSNVFKFTSCHTFSSVSFSRGKIAKMSSLHPISLISLQFSLASWRTDSLIVFRWYQWYSLHLQTIILLTLDVTLFSYYCPCDTSIHQCNSHGTRKKCRCTTLLEPEVAHCLVRILAR